MDVILTEKMDQALLKVAVTLLVRGSRRLMRSDDLEDVLTFLKQEMTGEGGWCVGWLSVLVWGYAKPPDWLVMSTTLYIPQKPHTHLSHTDKQT